jgi:hypothetical protein
MYFTLREAHKIEFQNNLHPVRELQSVQAGRCSRFGRMYAIQGLHSTDIQIGFPILARKAQDHAG